MPIEIEPVNQGVAFFNCSTIAGIAGPSNSL
jgi:hypothetical protein